MRQSRVFQSALLVLFVAFLLVWLHEPPYELHLLIHVVPTWIAVATLAASIRYFSLSNANFTWVVSFLALHVVGTRYIYSNVPYDVWATDFFGMSVSETLRFGRNHYDRVVHFCYGLLIAPVAREVYSRVLRVGYGWSCFLAVEFILASSAAFELIEWLGAVRLAPEFADSYLGQQGDVWDAHKDTALALLGATVIMTSAALWCCACQLITRTSRRAAQ